MPLTNDGVATCLSGPGLVNATRYLSLWNGDPTKNSSTELASGTATGYARIARTKAQMPVTGNQANIAAHEWTASAMGTWGRPSHWALMDASASGKVLAWGAFNPVLPNAIAASSRVYSDAGDLNITIPLS